MSLYGMMRTGVSGMNAQSNRLGTVADNIANSGTTGYKRSSTEFSSLVLPGGSGSYNSGAVKTTIRHEIGREGALLFTNSATDLSLSGNGFFVVNDASGKQFMTRAGSFVQDKNGQLVNAAGYRLMGYDLSGAGAGRTDPVPITLGGDTIATTPTTRLSLVGNVSTLRDGEHIATDKTLWKWLAASSS